MARFMSKNSGTASAVLGTTQFGFAGISSFVVGILNANSPVFLGLLICVSSFLAVVSYVFCNKINKVSLVKG